MKNILPVVVSLFLGSVSLMAQYDKYSFISFESQSINAAATAVEVQSALGMRYLNHDFGNLQLNLNYLSLNYQQQLQDGKMGLGFDFLRIRINSIHELRLSPKFRYEIFADDETALNIGAQFDYFRDLVPKEFGSEENLLRHSFNFNLAAHFTWRDLTLGLSGNDLLPNNLVLNEVSNIGSLRLFHLFGQYKINTAGKFSITPSLIFNSATMIVLQARLDHNENFFVSTGFEHLDDLKFRFMIGGRLFQRLTMAAALRSSAFNGLSSQGATNIGRSGEIFVRWEIFKKDNPMIQTLEQ